MMGVIRRETFLFLLLLQCPLPLASAQDTYYVKPTASEATPPCEDCLTLSEYAREASTYFNSDNLTLVFLPGEHSLDTTIVFELLESVLLVGNTASLPSITSKIVCSRQLAALSFVNVSKVELKALAFSKCGEGSNKPSDVVVDLDTLLEQSENMIPAVSAVFVPNFHLIRSSMEYCFLPLLLNRSRVHLQNNTVQYNVGYFGGAVAAYNSTLLFLGRNVFQYNYAEVGGGIFAKGSHLAFSGFTAFIGNHAEFGGGGVSAIDSCMSYNESLQQELLQTDLPYDSTVYTYVWNAARFGGGLLLAHSTVKQGEGTLEFTHNIACKGGGIYSKFSTVIFESRVLFENNSAENNYFGCKLGFGGATFVSFSMWTTTAVIFTGNTAVNAGGAVYTESSHMNFKGIAQNSDTPFFEACAHTCLMNNSAGVFDGGGLSAWNSTVEFDGNTLLKHNSAGAFGGGISAWSYNEVVFKCNTTFLQNSAEEGGGLSTSSTEVTIEGLASFIANSAQRGGGFVASQSSVIISGETIFVGNHGIIRGGGLYLVNGFLRATGNGTFINNTATYSGGAATCIDNCSLILEGEYTLIGNVAFYGGGISVNEGHVTVSGKNLLEQNRAVYGGAIFAKESKAITLVGENSFINNTARPIGYGGYGGGIHAVRTKIIVSGVLDFTNNSAWYGGGLSVTDYDSDHFIFVSQANISFFSNFAENRGGAVLIEGDPTDYCVSASNVVIDAGSCFLTFLNAKHASFTRLLETSNIDRNEQLHNYMQNCTSNIKLEGNVAKQGGDVIYGGALHVCRVAIPLEVPYWSPKPRPCGEESDVNTYVSGLEAVGALLNMTVEQMTANPRSITSDPFKVCICDNMKPDCSQRAVTQPVYPGETVFFPVVAVGQVNGVVPGVIHAQIIESEEAWIDELQSTQSVNMTCTDLSYTLASHGIGLANLSLSAEGPCGDSGIPLAVNLSFLACPVGFTLSQFGSCQCGRRLQRYTNSCDINSRTITRSRSSDFWLGVDDQSHDLILHPHCPFDYCKLEVVSFTLNSTDLQCADGRSGTLCGACQAGLSLSLGSSQCLPCSNTFLPLFIAFAIAGFLLVMFLFTCKVTVSAGTTSGLIFYANILAVNQSVFLPSKETNILTVFIAWLNLDLGIETCLFNGMDIYTWTWLQLCFHSTSGY